MTEPNDTAVRSAARIAAVGYIAMFVLAIFANFVVRQQLIDTDDAAATVEAIRDHEMMFRLGLIAFAVIMLLDVVVAWALYVVFASAGRSRSLLVAWFRLIYSALLGVAVVFMSLGLALATVEAGVDERLALLLLGGFDIAWLLGLLAFGVHLALLGTLIVRTRTAPRSVGVILIVAGIAYGVDTLLHMLLPRYEVAATIMLPVVAATSIIAEIALTVWLVLAGRRSSRVLERTPETASL